MILLAELWNELAGWRAIVLMWCVYMLACAIYCEIQYRRHMRIVAKIERTMLAFVDEVADHVKRQKGWK